jgi:CBS domain-containing protein
MKFLFSVILAFATINCYCQATYDSSYNKCIRAVINVEVRAIDQKEYTKLLNKLSVSNLSPMDKLEIGTKFRTSFPSKLGTAIFLEDRGKHFLVTARHVVTDEYSEGDSTALGTSIVLVENDSLYFPFTVDSTGYPTMNYHESMLWMFGRYRGYEKSPYILSSKLNDIAIICIDCDTTASYFYRTLVKRGYQPLTVKDIDTIFKSKTGDQIYSIGFPEKSIIGSVKLTGIHFPHMRSSIISVPVLTTGVYLKEYPKNSIFFDANMFVIHGFSGAPVISHNKLIGIVSGGEIVEGVLTGQKIPFKYLYRNHSKYIKASAIYDLLKQLRLKLKVNPVSD